MSKAKVYRIVQETHNVKSIFLEIEKPTTYQSSQFFMLNVNKVFNKELPQMPYSVSCQPDSKKLQITIRINKGGVITPYINRLKVGDVVEVVGPYGNFVYERGKTTLIGAGTGIAPLRGIMLSALSDQQEVEVCYSDRTEKDLIFKREFEDLAKDKIKLHLFVTREPENKRYITKRICNEFLKENLKKDGNFYVCGPPKFVEEIIEILKKIGIKHEQIKKEMFG